MGRNTKNEMSTDKEHLLPEELGESPLEIVSYEKPRNGWQRMYIQWVWSSPLLSVTDKGTYTILCGFANSETQECHPSTPQISKMLGLSRAVLYDRTSPRGEKLEGSLGKLERLGYISIRHVEEDYGVRNYYTILDRPEFLCKWDAYALKNEFWEGLDDR